MAGPAAAPAALEPNLAAIRAALDALFAPGAVVELRILNTPRAGTVSGYYDDHDRLARDAAALQRRHGCSVYATVNPPKRELLARAANRAVERARATTADTDIAQRRWFFVDLDPRRPAGLSATDAEHAAALALAETLRDALSADGWPDPVLADSGNGGHLLYRVDLPNDAESTALLRGCLEALALRFGDAAVDVDLTTFNPSRIGKLYGTVAMKGDSTAERPHRLARLLDVPAAITPVSPALLAALAARAPRPVPAPGYGGAFDLAHWIAEYGLSVAHEGEWNGGYRWVLRACPWNAEHTNRSAYIVRLANGAIAAGCQHNGCAGMGWRELRAGFEPDALRTQNGAALLRFAPEGTAGDRAGWGPEPIEGEVLGADWLPAIVTNNRELRDQTAAALAALCAANTRRPALFERAGQLCRVHHDEAGRPRIEPLDADRMRSHLARVADWVVANARTQTVRHVTPPAAVAADALAVGGWGLPPLVGLSELPPLRLDGSVAIEPGYDAASRLYYVPAPGFALPALPDAPTGRDVQMAAAAITDVLHDFPFVDAASRAAAWGAILTAVLRPAIPGNVPITLLDKPKAGTGASLLADVIAMIATGRPAAMQALPDDEEEFDKRVTASLADGAPLLVFDNADAPLRSGALSRMVTAATYRGRMLGHSRMVEYPQRAVVLVTGNNIKLRGDIARRSIWCRMDACVSRPWERGGWRHPALLEWVGQQRGGVVAAVLTLARAWQRAGRLDGGVRPLGSFEAWTRTIGGMLSIAGVPGFLANQRALYEQADEDAAQWAAFLAALADVFGAESFTSAAVATAMQREGGALRPALPDDLVEALDKPRLPNAIGTAFGQRLETRFDGRRLIRAGTHARAALWAIATDPESGESVSQSESVGAPDGNECSSPCANEPQRRPLHSFGQRGEPDSFRLTDSPTASTGGCADCGGPIAGPQWGRCAACLDRVQAGGAA